MNLAEPRLSQACIECEVEEIALELGWLRECPYHGEPFKRIDFSPEPAEVLGRRADLRRNCSAEALHAAALLASGYGTACRFCEREGAVRD